jgi:Raf kinase inhibitor-like YbhB/YbcL family protein
VKRIAPIVAAAVLLAGCGGGDKPDKPLPTARVSLRLESPAFRAGGRIPKRFTCDGKGVSPPLRWSGVPGGARQLALLVEDSDAGRFVHWSLLGIPPRTKALPEGQVPRGAVQTENGFGDRRWGGPCPPEGKGPHRYVFALYALDRRLGLGSDASADEVRSAIGEAAAARGTLSATYGR